jgi:hypothetical protein
MWILTTMAMKSNNILNRELFNTYITEKMIISHRNDIVYIFCLCFIPLPSV